MREILVPLGRLAGARVKGLRVRSVARGALAAIVVILSVPMGRAQKTTAPSASFEASAPSVLPAGLPDVLTMENGAKVTTPAEWAERRAELLKFFTHQMYGVAPPRPAKMRFVVADDTHNALGGIATRKQITILLNGTTHGPALHVLLYIPNQVKRPAVFVGLNFWGNETINADPGIFLPTAYTEAYHRLFDEYRALPGWASRNRSMPRHGTREMADRYDSETRLCRGNSVSVGCGSRLCRKLQGQREGVLP